MSGVLRSHMKVTALWVPQSCTSGSFTSSGGAPKYNSLSLNFICCSSAGEKDCWLCFGGCIVYYQAESTLCFADTIIQKDGFIIRDGGCSFLISTGVKWKISRGKKKITNRYTGKLFFLVRWDSGLPWQLDSTQPCSGKASTLRQQKAWSTGNYDYYIAMGAVSHVPPPAVDAATFPVLCHFALLLCITKGWSTS